MYQIVYTAANVFTLYIIYCFFEVLFRSKKQHTVLLTCAYLFQFLASSLFYFLFELPILNLIVTVSTMFLITLCYEDTLLKKILAVCYVYFVFFAVDVISVVMLGEVFLDPLGRTEYNNTLGLFVSKVGSFLVVMMVRNMIKIKRKEAPPAFVHIASIAIPVFTIITEVIFLNTKNITQNSVILSMILMMSINAITFILFDTLSSWYNQLLIKQSAEKEREYYYNQCLLMQNSAEDAKRLKHDIVNHYILLNELIASNNTPKAKEYLAQLLQESSQSKRCFVQTGNVVLDSILNYKLSYAKTDDMTIDMEIMIPTELPVEIMDLSVILSNLLDNALDALSKLQQQKELRIRVLFVKNVLVISVINSYDGHLSHTGGELTTTKSDTKNHGIGLKNIKASVERYNGILNIKHDPKYFTAEVLIYIPQK